MLITSMVNDRIKSYIKLKDRKYRKRTKTFIVEGLHSVLEAYKKNMIIELIIEKDEVQPFDVPCIYTTQEILNQISSLETPGKIMALCRMLSDEKVLGDRVLLLDNIQDPGNLGTIIRSAAAFNADTIVLSPDTVDMYSPKVIRSTQGMLFHLNIFVRDLSGVIDDLKHNEIPVYGTRVEYGEDVRTLKEKDKKKYALVLGNEGNGVRREILDKCDKFLCIEMNEDVESLNVAVAASIILYELDR